VKGGERNFLLFFFDLGTLLTFPFFFFFRDISWTWTSDLSKLKVGRGIFFDLGMLLTFPFFFFFRDVS
jgi:hypothetical protein